MTFSSSYKVIFSWIIESKIFLKIPLDYVDLSFSFEKKILQKTSPTFFMMPISFLFLL